MRSILLSALVAVAVVACGGAEKPAPKAEKPAVEEPKKAEPAPEAKPEAKAVEVGMDDGGEYPEVMIESDGDQMMYKQNAITIKADTPTRIKMVNNAQSPAMVHNVVIVKKGEGDSVGQAAVTVSAEKNHVPVHASVLAATKLAKPGETSTVVVNLPAGEYEYICTFPGHYVMMKGVLTVE
ncbi:MAG: plastocyanin/azurin family copper-binding protein [Myxococcota bacterium]